MVYGPVRRTRRPNRLSPYPRSRIRTRSTRRRARLVRRRRPRYRRSRRAYVRVHRLTNPTVPKSIVRRVHIPSTIHSTAFARKVARHVGHYHFLSYQATTQSAYGANRQFPCLRFHAGLGGLQFVNWNYVARDPSLTANDYVPNYPQFSRYLLAYTMLKLTIRQIQESGRVRLSLVRTSRMVGDPNNTLPLYNFTRDLDTFQSSQYYTVLWQKYVDFTLQPTNDTNARVATVNLYFPFWRMMETAKRAQATAETDWEPVGSRWFDFTYFVIDSDDDLNSDTKFFTYDIRVRSKFYELE